MAEELLTDAEQVEEVKRLVKEYGPVLLIGAVLGVGGFFGVRYYRGYQDNTALEAAGQFSQMAQALQLNDAKKAREVATGLLKDHPGSPYADQAQLTLARMDVDEGHGANAVEPLTAVMNNSKDSELKQIARLRLARVLVDQGKPDEALNLLNAGTAGSFAGRYHEVRADALTAKKDTAGAIKEYREALATEDAAGGADSALVEMKLADLGASPQDADLAKVKP
jgi:predicted negative regulator of RcsB-dependent stress response